MAHAPYCLCSSTMATSSKTSLPEALPPSPTTSLYSLSKDVDTKKDTPLTDDLVDGEPEPFKFLNVFRRRKNEELDAIATKRSVFDDPELAPHYWPKKEYENRHRFDPNARWTYLEEKALVRKIDWKVMLWAAISFSALNLDRNNLSQANTDNFLPDLGLTTNDYNWGNSIFKLAFLCAELPSQLVSKRVGPDRWIPTQMVLWSIVTIAQFWLSGRTSFFLCRALLGFIQGGFIPDLILYLSYFYTKNELPFRLALFWMSSNLCTIVASFIAFGVLHMRGILGRAGWRWLFLFEGLITLIIGIATFFRMPPSPTQSKTWFRPKGWFTEREETIAVTRILRDDPTKGDMHNREGLTLKRLWIAVCDYDLWPLYFIGLMFGIPTSPPSTYLTLSLRHIGFNTFQSNLLAIPSTVAGMITNFGITLVSETVNDRSFVAMAEDVWTLPFLVAIYCLPDSSQWLYFGLASGLLSYPYTHPIQVGWCSRNSGAVASRTVNASLYNMFVQASGIISAQIYRTDDSPKCRNCFHSTVQKLTLTLDRRGNKILIIICCFNMLIMYPGTKAYYIYRNRQRDRIWNAMTPQERKHYLETTTDIGNRRLNFRFAH
ncbi:allantoate permease [Guyanagaster necrorhizus]|uniref:Allantoate permease n=1 Tax=Guyanagaster necrorhizus TaxID=856835 RepID=A0A9P8ATA4_9AGAR|nr:allantoate permease [Guyanagaster necrorhizus MCA 3950]KAG7446990.1 allantoate permease [Guyanagaster necrorhizus MCA 3950]